MRKKLNSNPIAQVGLIAVLVVLGLVFFLKSSGGAEEEPEAGPTVATVNGSTATGDTPGEAVESAISGLEEGAIEAGATEVPTSVPTPPLPAAFTSAYDAGQTVVLLVVHDGGIDDRLTSEATDQIKGMPGVTLLRVPVKQLPRYAGVTLGLDVNRVPALIVMRLQRLSGGVPQATVDYGFQTPQSVVQAVRDASYAGPEETYHPD
ncbi:MAG: hypothetical protein JJE35_07630 [Thermoleophilia bacterium]|nr:hypothetical protein [Thermoleophilia bacterium]